MKLVMRYRNHGLPDCSKSMNALKQHYSVVNDFLSWAWYFLSFTNFNCTYYVCFVWIRALPTCNSKIKSVETRHPRCVVRWSGAARNIWPTGPMWTLDTSACHFAYVILCASVSWAIYWAIHHPNNRYCSVARSVSTLMDSCKYLIICLIVRYRIISEPEEGAWKSWYRFTFNRGTVAHNLNVFP